MEAGDGQGSGWNGMKWNEIKWGRFSCWVTGFRVEHPPRLSPAIINSSGLKVSWNQRISSSTWTQQQRISRWGIEQGVYAEFPVSTTGAPLEAELTNPEYSIVQDSSIPSALALAQPQGAGPGVSLGKTPLQFPVYREWLLSESLSSLAAIWVNIFLWKVNNKNVPLALLFRQEKSDCRAGGWTQEFVLGAASVPDKLRVLLIKVKAWGHFWGHGEALGAWRIPLPRKAVPLSLFCAGLHRVPCAALFRMLLCPLLKLLFQSGAAIKFSNQICSFIKSLEANWKYLSLPNLQWKQKHSIVTAESAIKCSNSAHVLLTLGEITG